MGIAPPKIVIETNLSPVSSTPPKKVSPTNDSDNCRDWRAEAKKQIDDAANSESPTDASNVFSYIPKQLDCLVDPKNAHVLSQMGGVGHLADKLHSNISTGLTDENLKNEHEMDLRIQMYGKNVLPDKKTKSLLQLMWLAMKDKVLIILSIAAIVSLALGLYETFGQPPEHDAQGRPLPKVDWVEGVAILVAIIIVVVVGAVNDWQKERQFVKLNKKKNDHTVNAVRNGQPVELSVFEVLAGDVLITEPGDMLPVDGVVISSNDLKCDESAASGESETVKKYSANDATSLAESNNQLAPTDKRLDCFVLSGSRVLEGTGRYLVIAVGPNSMHGRTMLSLHEDPEATPLQEKLDAIAEGIAKFGLLAALVLFIALMIRFFAQLPGSDKPASKKGQDFMNVLITAITIVVVAVPEGLPLAVTLALAFATTRMIRDNNLVRVLKSCETMGSATSICSDKTGTLTQNMMTVVAGTFGLDKEFELDDQQQGPTPAGTEQENEQNDVNRTISGDSPERVLGEMPEEMQNVLLESIALNSTAFESKPEDRELYVGSKTEVALLTFANHFLSLGNLENFRHSSNVVKTFPFDSRRKYMITVVREHGKRDICRVFIKGASEVIVAKCKRIIVPSTGETTELTADDEKILSNKINTYASKSLRTIAIGYSEIDRDEFESIMNLNSEDEIHGRLLANPVLFGIVGIMDPLRPGVASAVASCQRAGVTVRMVTGDNIVTARAIAKNCGILKPGDSDDEIAMEGPDFRKLDAFELRKVVPRLRVLARSSPQDKKKLVKYLKSRGEVVAVTGDGINDVPALTAADIGFSMGIAGTEVAKEASEIILMDDNFGSIVKAMMWGRTVNDSVKKFLQFQLTVNVTAVVLTFISAVANSENTSVLTAVQLLWVNLIMDTFAALALATDPPVRSVLDRKPDSRKNSLITVTMWKMILGQAILQLIITFILHFAGDKIFHPTEEVDHYEFQGELAAMVFNTFVWLQFFNLFVNRRLDNKQNILEGITENYFFIVIVFIIGGFQVLIMFVGGAAFSIHRQTGAMWGTALICGLLSIPWGALLRCIPDSWVMKLYPSWLAHIVFRLLHWRKKRAPGIVIEENDDEANIGLPNYKWNSGIERVRDELRFIKFVKGGRVSALKFRPKQLYHSIKDSLSPTSDSSTHESPTATLRDHENATGSSSGGLLAVPNRRNRRGSSYSSSASSTLDSHSPSIGAFAMVPAIVGGAIAGWSPEVREDAPEGRNSSREEHEERR